MSRHGAGERANMAAFLEASLLPVVDEARARARHLLLTYEAGDDERRVEWVADRLDELQHGALLLWRDLLTEPAQSRAAGQ